MMQDVTPTWPENFWSDEVEEYPDVISVVAQDLKVGDVLVSMAGNRSLIEGIGHEGPVIYIEREMGGREYITPYTVVNIERKDA